MDHLFTNQLINETSPYLLQHAHNPVNWLAWNDETLSQARKAGKPILLSIGYSACHWCHVMEHESFEDEVVAAYMNEHFINIKVDREERPDVDHLYMDAVQLMAGNGGWPLNVFLTPGTKPFYGGTYYPPKPAFNRPSWMQVLTSIKDAWDTKKNELESQADNLIAHLKDKSGTIPVQQSPLENLASMGEVFTKEDCITIASNLLKNADKNEGGFGKAPKFPQTFSIIYLLQHSHFFADEEALCQAELSLTKMLAGGIYDQLGGGFARYSTDEKWLAPHFEKMLYDNALIITALAEAAFFTGKEIYKETIIHTIHFVNSALLDPAGGFYAALDADSEGIEGKYYVWSFEEINSLLGEDAGLFSAYYNVVREGNWEHENILHIKDSLEAVAGRFGLDTLTARKKIDTAKSKLLAARARRIAPGTDNKIILGWNALMVTALCKAYRACNDEAYKDQAINLYKFLFDQFSYGENGAYKHCLTNGKLSQPAFLDDYAYLAEAAIALQEITGISDYLLDARSLIEHTEKYFSGDGSGLFYYTSTDQEDVLVRKQETYDGALPSSNAVLARNFLYLGRIFENENWIIKAQNWQQSLMPLVLKYPGSFGCWALEIQKEAAGVNEIVITGEGSDLMLKEYIKIYFPNVVLQSSKIDKEGFPLLSNKSYIRKTFIYVCRNQACLEPLDTINGLIDVIKSTLFNKFDGNI